MRLLLVLLLLGGCTDFLAPMPGDPMQLQTPTDYPRWYALAESCLGRSGDFSRVRWYYYPNATRVPGKDRVIAFTWESQHKIAIAGFYVHDSMTVIHEAMHDILGVHGHPAEYFGTPMANGSGWLVGGQCSALISPQP